MHALFGVGDYLIVVMPTTDRGTHQLVDVLMQVDIRARVFAEPEALTLKTYLVLLEDGSVEVHRCHLKVPVPTAPILLEPYVHRKAIYIFQYESGLSWVVRGSVAHICAYAKYVCTVGPTLKVVC